MDKYPKTIIDESSGIEVTNDLYKAYREGYLECDKKWLPIIDRIRKDCILEGIKEVVEWLLSEGGFPWLMDEYPERIGPWQAKLKEWGIKE